MQSTDEIVCEESAERFFRIAGERYGIKRPVTVVDKTEFCSIASLPSAEDKEYQLEPLFAAGEFVVIHGAQKTGKSFFSSDLAMAVAHGKNYDTRFRCSKSHQVLIVDAELPGHEIKSRLNNINGLYGNDSDADRVKIIPLQEMGKTMDLSTSEDQDWVYNQVKKSKAEVVVLDNLGKLIPPQSETSPEVWRKVETWVRSMNREGVTVILVHHTNKNGEMRGTGKISDDADLVLGLSKPDDWDRTQGTAVDVKIVDTRFLHGEQEAPFRVVYSERNGKFAREVIHDADLFSESNRGGAKTASLELDEYDLTALQMDIMKRAARDVKVVVKDFETEERGRSRSSVSKALSELAAMELLVKEGKGRAIGYRLSDKDKVNTALK